MRFSFARWLYPGMVVALSVIASLRVATAAPAEGPAVAVLVAVPGASPRLMDGTVAVPLGPAMDGLSDVVRVETESAEGNCRVVVRFGAMANAEQATARVAERTARVVPQLPRDSGQPRIVRGDPRSLAPYWVSLRSGRRSLAELTRLADTVLDERLAVLVGTREVRQVGGVEVRPTLWLDPDKLATCDVSAGEVVQAITARPVEGDDRRGGGGRAVAGDAGRADVIFDHELIEQTVVRVVNGMPVRVRDVGRFEVVERPTGFALADGAPAVLIAVTPGPGGPSATEVRKRLGDVAAELPPDVKAELALDLSAGRAGRSFLIELRLPAESRPEASQRLAAQAVEALARLTPNRAGCVAFAADERNVVRVLLRDAAAGRATAAELRKALGTALVGARTRVCELDARGGDGLAIAFPLRVALTGPEPATLARWADAAAAQVAAEGAAADVDVAPGADAAQLEFAIDRNRAAKLGLNVAALSEAIAQAAGRAAATVPLAGGRSADVRVAVADLAGLHDGAPAGNHALARWKIRTPAGELVPLAAVANVRAELEPLRLLRINGARAVVLSAAPADGVAASVGLVRCEGIAAAEGRRMGLAPEYRVIKLTPDAP